jgi:predicted nuclease of predicted toxin-antitoxin system
MKFVVDAQLPRRIALMLRDHAHDAVHTLDLPEANRTTDSAILDLADREERVVITKDADFVNSFLLSGRPEKLLLISTGNISNAELAGVLLPNLESIVAAFATSDFVELTRTSLITHA